MEGSFVRGRSYVLQLMFWSYVRVTFCPGEGSYARGVMSENRKWLHARMQVPYLTAATPCWSVYWRRTCANYSSCRIHWHVLVVTEIPVDEIVKIKDSPSWMLPGQRAPASVFCTSCNLHKIFTYTPDNMALQ